MKHLRIGGSSFNRTMGCNLWLEKSKDIPYRPAGAAAREGSMHHEIMEMCQKKGTEPKDHLGFVYEEDGHSLTFDEDDLDLSVIAYNATNDLLDELDIDALEVEPFVQVIPDEAGGSIDILGLSEDGKTILVLDYKFGQVKVSPKENAQMLFYAMAASIDEGTADLYELVEKVELVIIQPRVKGTVFRWSCSMADLAAFADEAMRAIEATQNPKKGAKPTPGTHCKWCPAEPYCEEKRQRVHSATVLGARSHNEMTEAAAILEEVEDWVKAMKEALYMNITNGVTVNGWKVVDKKATRKWIDAKEAEKTLLDKKVAKKLLYKTDFLTMPALEKALKKAKVDFDLEPLMVKSSSGTTLAPEADPREAVVVTDVVGGLADIMGDK